MVKVSTLLFYNFKGGVGKTTISVLAADHLAQSGKNVLLIDLDAQASASNFIEKSYGAVKPDRPLIESLMKESLLPSICHVTDHFDLIPSDWNMSHWNEVAEEIPARRRNLVLSYLINEIKDNYDYIFLDVPPTLSTLVNNAVLASDFITLVFQTQSSSLDGIRHTMAYLQQLRSDYNASFQLLGIILYLVSKRENADMSVEREARKLFEGNEDIFFEHPIYQRARVKHWATFGITHNHKDVHDRRTHKMYSDVVNEVLERISD